MRVKKRDGKIVRFSGDEISHRLEQLCTDERLGPKLTNIDVDVILISIYNSLYDGVSTSEIDDLAAKKCISRSAEHPEFADLAARITISNLQKNTSDCFSSVMEQLYNHVDITGKHSPLISEQGIEYIREHKKELNNKIDHSRDFLLAYMGISTLQGKGTYLKKINKKTVERPQYLWMRVAIALAMNESLQSVFDRYDELSQKFYIHATPTLMNALSPNGQYSSCFLMEMDDDSIECGAGIFKTVSDAAVISKGCGGEGINACKLRCENSYIRGTGGYSNGLMPFLRIFNETAVCVNQGGKRPGSFSIYIEPWHADIEDFIHMRTNTGNPAKKSLNLFNALWIPDLFFEYVNEDREWYLMDPNICKGLNDCYGEEFRKLYEGYVAEGKYIRSMKAQELMVEICKVKIEGGIPYLLNKDTCNFMNNQKNIGTIKCSNLCCEIIEYTDRNEQAVCNLASIALPTYIRYSSSEEPSFDHDLLHKMVKRVTRNLDNIIDINSYPTPETRTSNMRHRPIGIGIQGLADVYNIMRYPFDSREARKLNCDIHETIYHAALESSMELAIEKGAYSTFGGSPASQGLLQFDLWQQRYDDFFGKHPEFMKEEAKFPNKYTLPTLSGRYDWSTLKLQIIENGLRNSMLVALMPTKSTSHILGFNECFEPILACFKLDRTQSGEHMSVNKYLIKDLIELGIWNEEMKNTIKLHRGSIQNIDGIPQNIKDLYKTAGEISTKEMILQSRDRSLFVCQSQSLNWFDANANVSRLSTAIMDSWKMGNKTINYYMHTKSVTKPVSFDIKQKGKAKENIKQEEEEDDDYGDACPRGCDSCGA